MCMKKQVNHPQPLTDLPLHTIDVCWYGEVSKWLGVWGVSSVVYVYRERVREERSRSEVRLQIDKGRSHLYLIYELKMFAMRSSIWNIK
jgi:hypothetical protein